MTTTAAPDAAARLPLVQLTDLRVGYQRRAILPPISATIAAGELWAVIGPNGAGKSTFVRTLLGLQAPVAGRVDRAERLRMSYVPQQSALDTIFPVSVGQFVRMGRQAPGRFAGRPSRADGEVARAALAEVGAADLARQQLRDLSGGQRQRVLIARAIASGANLFVLDEPTAALDIAAERTAMDLIAGLRARAGAAVVMVTHLIEDTLARADRALLLDRDHDVALAAGADELRASAAFVKIYGRTPIHGSLPHGGTAGAGTGP
ncbi:MAG TPA: metal ABC transporter ATP-binding protein [Polyangia bacterium]|nr:metal ABC transporter ATP-binding protein [Polyangia bacterium]